MKTKFKIQTFLFSVASLMLLLLLIDLVFLQRDARKEKVIDKKQHITIPFQEIKEKLNNERS